MKKEWQDKIEIFDLCTHFMCYKVPSVMHNLAHSDMLKEYVNF